MAGVTNDIYANSVSLSQTMAGLGDVAFGSGMGQILFARSTSKKKYDGSSVINWGVAQPNAAPTVATIASDSKTFASGATADYTNWTQTEGTMADKTTYIEITPATTTGRGTITKTLASPTSFATYDAGATAGEDDLFNFLFLVTEPQLLQSVRVQIDVNDGTFASDYYYYEWYPGQLFQPDFDEMAQQILQSDPNTYLLSPEQVREALDSIKQGLMSNPRFAPSPINPVLGSSTWNNLSIRRGSMTRVGSTAAKNWGTVKAIQMIVQCAASTVCGFKTILIQGGTLRTLTGRYKWAAVAVRDTASYEAKSKPSTYSAEVDLKSQAATVTVAKTVIDALITDGNATHVWLFRRGGVMDNWYRVATAAIPDPSAKIDFTDTLSDKEAMIANITMELDNEKPPDNIIGIVGPHFDRMFCLTATMLYPSKKLDLDSYASGQAITICGVDETALWIAKTSQEIYIGTNRDIYRISGYGDEAADGSLDFAKIGLGIGNPPISKAFAQEGNTIVYLAADGWRVFTGSDSISLRGDTDLLWRGYTRHGVSPINVSSATARFVAAISKGMLSAITPEGSSTTYSSVLHRYNINQKRWYRHTYTPLWRSIYREPDGTLVAGDNNGFIWTLDNGTSDAGTAIPVIVWTGVDDNDQPYTTKQPIMHRVRMDTGGLTASVSIHLNGSSTPSAGVSPNHSGEGTTETDVHSVSRFKQIQHRITGSFGTFKLFDLWCDYKERPIGRLVWDLDIDTGVQDLTWIREVKIKVLAGATLTITPYFDGSQFVPYTATPVSTDQPVIITVPVGREYKGFTPRIVVTSSTEFFPYWIELRYRGTGTASQKKIQRVSI